MRDKVELIFVNINQVTFSLSGVVRSTTIGYKSFLSTLLFKVSSMVLRECSTKVTESIALNTESLASPGHQETQLSNFVNGDVTRASLPFGAKISETIQLFF